ncbi:hypothetical protein [Nostoc sp.]
MAYRERPYQQFTPVDDDGNIIGSAGNGSGGSNATADNQATQITRETQILNAIATLALQFPSAPVGDRLKVDVPALSDPPTNTALTQILAAIKAQIDVASTVWTDNSGAFYVRRDLVNESNGTATVSFTDPLGNAATPGSGLRSLSNNKTTLTDFYDVLTGGVGYSIGDLLARIAIIDTSTSTPTATFIWLNFSLGTILSAAPTTANIESSNETIGARQVGTWIINLPTGAAISAKQPALGTAGSASTDVLTFQGIAGGIPLNTISSDINTTGNITTADLVSATVIGANNQSIITGIPTANSSVSISANGYNSFLVQVAGTWTGTLQSEVSFDGGTIWYPGSGFLSGTSYTVNSTTNNCAIKGNATDATNVRVRATTAITGTANIRINLSQTIDPITVRNPIRLFDSVSGVQASIKPANIPATASDTALVVTTGASKCDRTNFK